jgi:hypothetical protein
MQNKNVPYPSLMSGPIPQDKLASMEKTAHPLGIALRVLAGAAIPLVYSSTVDNGQTKKDVSNARWQSGGLALGGIGLAGLGGAGLAYLKHRNTKNRQKLLEASQQLEIARLPQASPVSNNRRKRVKDPLAEVDLLEDASFSPGAKTAEMWDRDNIISNLSQVLGRLGTNMRIGLSKATNSWGTGLPAIPILPSPLNTPWFLPTLAGGAMLAGTGAYVGVNNKLKDKRKHEAAERREKAEREFNEMLLAEEKQGSFDCSKKKIKFDAALDKFIDTVIEKSPIKEANIMNTYLNVLGGLLAVGGTAGLIHGYLNSKSEADFDKAMYLRRRQVADRLRERVAVDYAPIDQIAPPVEKKLLLDAENKSKGKKEEQAIVL